MSPAFFLLHKSHLRVLSIQNIIEAFDGRFPTPRVTIKTGLTAPDGREEELTEYLCDYPNCPNVATHTVGVLVELRQTAALCDVHAVRQ